MTETHPDDVRETAQAYLDALATEIDRERKQTLRTEIAEYEQRHQELVAEHGADHRLARRAEGALDARREELDEIEAAEERLRDCRVALLETVVGTFDLTEGWLRPEVVEAVTHALYNERDDQLSLFGEPVTAEAVAELGEFERIDRAEVVILLAKNRLGDSNRAWEQYRRLAESDPGGLFETLADEGPLGPEALAEAAGLDRRTVADWLEAVLGWDHLVPLCRRADGTVALSTTGRYQYEHFQGREPGTEELDGEGLLGSLF